MDIGCLPLPGESRVFNMLFDDGTDDEGEAFDVHGDAVEGVHGELQVAHGTGGDLEGQIVLLGVNSKRLMDGIWVQV